MNMEYKFEAEKVKDELVVWVRNWFQKNGKGCKGVVGVSGGKDSSVVAALLKEALGKENVFGVLMPRGVQPDIDVSKELVEFLDIPYTIINIQDAYQGIMGQLEGAKVCQCEEKTLEISNQTVINLAPRLRMSTLYAVSQSVNGRVVNTCNLSEDWVGYSTRYGDSAGDFSPLGKLTVQEVKAVGRALGLPDKFVEKAPSDGLCGKTDEDNLGFTYAALDHYIRTGICEDVQAKEKMDRLHVMNKFKLELMPMFEYNGRILAQD